MRVEGPDKVAGRARYSCDVRLPGQLYAAVLRSPLPHARVRRVDLSKALKLPGVHATSSEEDIFKAFEPDLARFEAMANAKYAEGEVINGEIVMDRA